MADNVNNELAQIERKLDEQHGHLKRQRAVSLVVGVVLLIVVAAYMSWIGKQIRTMTEPEGVSDVAAEFVRKNLPEARKAVAKQAEENLPVWLDSAVDGLIETGMPKARMAVEENTIKYVDEHLAHADKIVRENIDEALATHSEEIIMYMKNLDTDEGRKEFEDRLYGIIDESLNDESIKVEMESYGLALEEVSRRLSHITDVAHMRGDAGLYATDQEKILADLISVMIEMGRRMNLGEMGTGDLGEALGIGD